METFDSDAALHLARLGNILDNARNSRKKPIVYSNYTNVMYDIVTNKNFNAYYRKYKRTLPCYVREQSKWSTSRRTRNTTSSKQSLLQDKAHSFTRLKHNDLKTPDFISSYKSNELGMKPGLSSLPNIKRNLRLGELQSDKRLLSLGRRWDEDDNAKIVLNKELMKRAVQLGSFVKTIKTAQGKNAISGCAKKLLLKLRRRSEARERNDKERLESVKGIIESTLGVPPDPLDDNGRERKKGEASVNALTKK